MTTSAPILALRPCANGSRLAPTDRHLDEYNLRGTQWGAHAGCSGTVDNLLTDRMVTLDCHRGRCNLSMTWSDVKRAYDPVDHDWLNGEMLLLRFLVWL